MGCATAATLAARCGQPPRALQGPGTAGDAAASRPAPAERRGAAPIAAAAPPSPD